MFQQILIKYVYVSYSCILHISYCCIANEEPLPKSFAPRLGLQVPIVRLPSSSQSDNQVRRNNAPRQLPAKSLSQDNLDLRPVPNREIRKSPLVNRKMEEDRNYTSESKELKRSGTVEVSSF